MFPSLNSSGPQRPGAPEASGDRDRRRRGRGHRAAGRQRREQEVPPLLAEDVEENMGTRIDSLLAGCLNCRQSCEDSEALYCKRCGTRLTAGQTCWGCARFYAPGTLDDKGLCPACREKRRE